MKKYIIFIYRTIKSYFSEDWGSLWNFKKGFLRTTVLFCGINKKNYTEFVSDREFRAMHPLNGPFSGIIDNKIYLPYLFKDYFDVLPIIYFFKDQYGFLPIDSKNKTRLNVDDFLSFLKKINICVMKHTFSEVGKGFMLVEYDYNGFKINRKYISEEDLKELLFPLQDYIVEEYVEQHSKLNIINSSSLNTLRLLLVWSKKANSFVLARAFMRFGCNGNVIDNLGSGNGILVYVDVENGEFKNVGVQNIQGKGEIFMENCIHPNSGFVFAGEKIPNFDQIKTQVIDMMNSVSFLKFVALDVAITEQSFKIIETNSFPAIDIAQYNKGFKSDPNFDHFFKYNG